MLYLMSGGQCVQYPVCVQYPFVPKFLCLFVWYICVSKITLCIGYCTHPYTNATQKLQTRFLEQICANSQKKTIIHNCTQMSQTALYPLNTKSWYLLAVAGFFAPAPHPVLHSLSKWMCAIPTTPRWMCAIPSLAPLSARNTNIFTKLNNLHQYLDPGPQIAQFSR